MIRSSVSRSVVKPSRGNPENADLAVFITTRSSTPPRTLGPPVPTDATAVLVIDASRRKACSPGRSRVQ